MLWWQACGGSSHWNNSLDCEPVLIRLVGPEEQRRLSFRHQFPHEGFVIIVRGGWAYPAWGTRLECGQTEWGWGGVTF